MNKHAWIVPGISAIVMAAGLLSAGALKGEDKPKDTAPAALPAEKELFAKESWYKEQPGKEQEFVGVLKRVPRKGEVGFGRFNPFRLEMKNGSREVYIGDAADVLLPYVGQRVKLIGKAVDMVVEGTAHLEIWPARLVVLDPGTMKEVTEALPAVKESE